MPSFSPRLKALPRTVDQNALFSADRRMRATIGVPRSVSWRLRFLVRASARLAARRLTCRAVRLPRRRVPSGLAPQAIPHERLPGVALGDLLSDRLFPAAPPERRGAYQDFLQPFFT